MVAQSGISEGPPGVLYFDPTPSSSKWATETLQKAGFRVFHAPHRESLVQQCTQHGPSGDEEIAVLVLDASGDSEESTQILRELVKIPGAEDLPALLLLGQDQARPIPGMDGMLTLQRPFSGSSLIRALQQTLQDSPRGNLLPPPPTLRRKKVRGPKERLRDILEAHLPPDSVSDALVHRLYRALDHHEDLPPIGEDCQLHSSLRTTPLEAILEMLGHQQAQGIITVTAEDGREGQLHINRGQLCLSEYRDEQESLSIGRFIADAGLMAAKDIDAFAAMHHVSGLPLGRQLLQAQKLQAAELSGVLRAQCREIACHLLSWRDGLVSFRSTPRPHALVVAAMQDGVTSLSIAEVVLLGLRRLDEQACMGAFLPQGDEIYLRNDEQLVRMGREQLDRLELQVLEQLNGQRTLGETARKLKLGQFAVSRAVYRLAKARLVRPRLSPVLSPL